MSIRLVNADTNAVHGDLLLADSTDRAIIVTLPSPWVGLPAITVKKTTDNRNNVTVARSGSALIDDASTVVLSNVHQAVTLVANGTNWVLTASVAGSAPSAGRPGAPTIGAASAGITSAGVAFTPPASDGGSTITGYTATSSPGGITGTGASSPITVSGLTAGTAYTFTVHATNAIGDSPESAASNSVTPTASAGPPGAPTIGTATAGDTTATANWSTPSSDGGSAITGYQVKTYDGSGSLIATDTVGVVLTITKTGLTNGTAVKFKVAAINAIGTGAQSAFSNTVTPSPPVSGTQWLTSWTPQTLRSDFGANLGCRITVGSSSISVTALGRWVHSGNTQNHTVKLVRASDSVEMASVVVATAGVTADTFAETALGTPVTLAASTDYFLLSSEVVGGDTWGDLSAGSGGVSTTAVAACDFAAYESGTFTTTGVASNSYVPVSFRYA